MILLFPGAILGLWLYLGYHLLLTFYIITQQELVDLDFMLEVNTKLLIWAAAGWAFYNTSGVL